VGVSFWKLDVSAYWFQPGGISQSFVLSIGLRF